jgi:Holliday junction resolvase
MNTKAKGSRNEKKTIRLLEASGYQCTKAAASLGTFDIWAISSTDVALVQVKSNRWPGSMEMDQIKAFPAPPNARKLVHRWDDHKRIPMVKEL